ncbi:MAG: hypothetical protein ABI625_08075 [bacterium]
MTSPFFKSNLTLPSPVADSAPQQLCASDRPLVLLPVRLETRFFPLAGVPTELRVRVYPDKIHLDSHETDLRPSELRGGQQYWQADWNAGSNADARATAWRHLADNYGPARAAFVARSLTPTNPQGRTATPPAPPVFPVVNVATVDEAWRNPPHARLLPDRWIAVLHSGTAAPTKVTGKDIPRPLPVGPNPSLDDSDIRNDAAVGAGTKLATDPGMNWMIDFTEAENVGMALRIPVTPAMLAAGLDSLFVFGVSKSLDSTTTATQLADLFDAHHYTDGLEFLRFGTPTNNTDDRRVAESLDDETHQRSFGLEVIADPSTLDSESNATRVASAFGITPQRAPSLFGHLALANDQHDLHMRSMNNALWPVGWGYFLSNILGPETAGLTPTIIDWARTHFVNSVRSGGPFPTLRAGRQPYGLLPVTSLDLWKPKVGDETLLANDTWLQAFLIKIRESIWRQALPSVARLGSRGASQGIVPEADADLSDVMGVDALSSSYRTQSLYGPHYQAHLRAFFNEDLTAKGYFPALDAISVKGLQAAGLNITPRLKRATYAGMTYQVSAPLVQAGEVSPWKPLEPDYIGALLGHTKISDIIAEMAPSPTAGASPSLLQTLLRHSLLREISDTISRIAATSGNPPTVNGPSLAVLQRDAELIDLVRDPADPNGLTVVVTQTWKRLLTRMVPAVTGSQNIQNFLETLPDYTASAVATLGATRGSMAHLQGLDSELLQHLMQGTLDLSAHRLDAWMTSFATKRLAAMTGNAQQGAYVGGYGWVENLVPLQGVAVTPPAGETGQMFTLPNDTGFIHAPSTTHASAAALLRNAHLGAANVALPNSPFAIDLSSRRVREASNLLDGVREGQPLGALLGYRMERSLHDRGLDQFIAPLRELAPIAPSTLPINGAPTQTIAANNVVDGQLLYRRWIDEQSVVTTRLAQVSTVAADVAAVKAELDLLGEAIDGVSDALVAEAAYQMSRGNTSRIASTLAAISKGDAPPPELEVARMPRTGTALTHRVLSLFGGVLKPTAGWAPLSAAQVRSFFEPNLAAWVSQLLGDASKVRCTVERLDDATGAVLETRAFPLSAVQFGPLDFVYAVEEGSTTQTPSTLTEAEQLVLYYSRHTTGGFNEAATLRLQHARPSDLAAGEVTLFDLLEQARAIRRLFAGVRALDPEDLNPPERTATGALDLVELETRLIRAEATLLSSNNQLAGDVARAGTTCDTIRISILRLGQLGIAPAVPIIASGESPAAFAALQRQGRTMLKISAQRMAKGAELRTHPVATSPTARRDQLLERFHTVFGASYLVLTYFTLDAPTTTELKNGIAASTQTQGGDALAANTWFARSARVRAAVARMGGCLRTAEILNTGARLDLKVAQLPFLAGERWVGLPPLANTTIPNSKLSLVLHTLGTITAGARLYGLVVDEWTEVIPNVKETTALTFQYNPPDASAPQSVLLAVPPIPENDWTVESLHRVLMETLDMAKLRAVDPDLLGAVYHYLPGLYLAFNAKDDTVSTNFVPLTS